MDASAAERAGSRVGRDVGPIDEYRRVPFTWPARPVRLGVGARPAERAASVEARIRELGHEIFELAEAARPGCWNRAWWQERVTQWLDRDDQLRTRAFQFVDCLPSLRSDEDIRRHVEEYFFAEGSRWPGVLRALTGPGTVQAWRSAIIGRVVRRGAVQMAQRFITGYDVPSTIRALQKLRASSMAFTLDVLGESTTSDVRADAYAGVYHDLIDRLVAVAGEWPAIEIIDFDGEGPMPRVNLSIKLTGLDPHFDAIDPERAMATVGTHLRPLLRHAKEAGAFVNIDMESFAHRDLTLETFKRVLMEEEFRSWRHVGIALQAYLRDAQKDLEGLMAWGRRRGTPFAVRLVKGAYWDAEVAAAARHYTDPPVWTAKWQSDACFERMARTMLKHADLIRPAFASHNVRSLAAAMAAAEQLGVSKREYEVQMLYGMGDPLKTAMVQLGCCVRVYCPYGELMPGMGYLIRRLLENTSNEGFLKQGFVTRGGRDQLLTDPAEVKGPVASLPGRNYVNTNPEEPVSEFRNAANTNLASEENRQKMLGALDYVRGEMGRTWPLIIAGQNISTEQWFESVNPSRSGQIVGRIAQASADHADRAVSAARNAFADWRHTSGAERAALLRRVADRLEMRRFELSATMIFEVGKPWREADADVTEAIDHWRFHAEQIERIEARPRLRHLPGEDNTLTYSPRGVCAVLSPWAFPLAILSGMAGAALAAGNTVVLKPARAASVTAAKLMEVLQEAGFPPGVVNYLPGPGEALGPCLARHAGVHIVAFTGSREAGCALLEAGARVGPNQPFIRKMIVEMGGKNAIIVDEDADLDAAVQATVESAFAFAGQKCSSCSRLIVLESVHDALVDRVREAVESLPTGRAEEPATIVGPVIDEAARERIRQYVRFGRGEGRLIAEPKLPPSCDEGFFVAPTVFDDVPAGARIAQEEIFGPVLAVLRAKDFSDALAIANGTPYGLTGGLFSRSPSRIERARREFAVGNLYINRRITGSQVDAQPFGGIKLSGTGVKAGSPEYLLHFVDARCITENTARSGFVPDHHQLPTR